MNNQLSKEEMERMIQKYKEEAMRYQEKSSDLYREEIPAREVRTAPSVAVGETETENSAAGEDMTTPCEMGRAEEKFADGKRDDEFSAQAAELSERNPEELDPHNLGDIRYVDHPVTVEEAIRESNFRPSSVPYSDTGRLIVEVSAGERSFPVSFANVLVLRKVEGEKELYRYLQTDESGNTPVIELPAPSRDLSGQPEPESVIPYGVYTVVVSHAAYYTTIIWDVQIFAGQTAILPVSMVPLSELVENRQSAADINFETGPHSLTE